MDVFYNKLEADPSTIGMDVVGGRLDLVSATSIKWGFQNSNQIRLVNPDTGRWELVKCATEPTLANNATDLNGTALAVDKIYDVFAEYSSATVFTLVCSKWASYGAGTSSRVAAYASGTTYAIGDRVTYDGHDWVCIQSGTGQTPAAGAYWVDNGVAADVGSNSDFYGLYKHDGVLVSSSSTTGKSRRWLGIIYTYNNSGTVNFKDDVNYRYVSNYYNTKFKPGKSYNSSSSWVPANGSYKEFNNGTGQIRANFIISTSQQFNLTNGVNVSGSSGQSIDISIGVNTANSSTISCGRYCVLPDGYGALTKSVVSQSTYPAGYHFITQIEYGVGTITQQGNYIDFSCCNVILYQ